MRVQDRSINNVAKHADRGAETAIIVWAVKLVARIAVELPPTGHDSGFLFLSAMPRIESFFKDGEADEVA